MPKSKKSIKKRSMPANHPFKAFGRVRDQAIKTDASEFTYKGHRYVRKNMPVYKKTRKRSRSS